MDDPNDRLKFWFWLGAILLAAIGGPLGYLSRAADSGERTSKKMLLLQTLSAAFSGCIVLMICINYEMSMPVTGIACGVSGWMGGGPTLNLVLNQFKSKLGINQKGGKDEH